MPNKHLDPAWGAKLAGISLDGEILYLDRDGEAFALEERGGNIGRVARPDVKQADALRLRHARSAAKALDAAAEKADVPVDVILALRVMEMEGK